MEATASPATAPLALREKLGYAVGDTGFNFFWKNIEVFLLFFYTDVFGISAAAAGTLFLVTRLSDAVSDPLMGMVADRTRSRYGKFRPYLLWGALPLAAAAVLTYTTPDLPAGGKLVWAYASYVLLMLCYTVANIPYSAMLGVITADSQQRTTLTSYRFVAAFSGGVLVTWFTPKLVAVLGRGDVALGWQLCMLVYAVLAVGLLLVSFATTTERVQPDPSQRSSLRQDLADLLGNRHWLVLFVLGLVVIMTISLRNASAVYYFKYYLGRADLVGPFLTVSMVAYALGAAVTPMLARWVDKRALLMLLMAVVGGCSALLYLVPADAVWAVFVLGCLTSLALGPKSPLVWSMYADTADFSEWRTGRRATALVFSAATFALKLGGALAAALIGWLLGALGYQANAEQAAAATTGIVLLMSLIPGGFAVVAVWVTSRYGLDAAMLHTLQVELDARRASVH